MKALILVVIMILAGCTESRTMSRKEVMDAVDECTARGFNPSIGRSGIDFSIIVVECLPKKTTGDAK
jgi:PBP1b-binding outer membrane lipoprotein LpoB